MLPMFLFACSTTPVDSDPPTAVDAACLDDAHVDQAVCEADSACLAEFGRPCDGSADPEFVFVGCLPADALCNDIVLYCEPDDGSQGCVGVGDCPWAGGGNCPPGWSTCTEDTDAPFCE